MHAKPELVRSRRFKRRMKAVASIAVALCAGVFLACQKTQAPEDAGASDAAGEDASGRDAATERDGSGDAGSEAGDAATDGGDAAPDGSRAMVKRPGGARDAAVDVREHRKGMPVRDNLLE